MQTSNVSGKQLREAYSSLSLIKQVRVQSSTTYDELVATLQRLNVPQQQIETVLPVARPMLYELKTVTDCVEHLTSAGVNPDSAKNICQEVKQWADIGTNAERKIASTTWKQHVVDEFRHHISIEDVLSFTESLVGAVPSDTVPQEEHTHQDTMMSNNDVTREIRTLCGAAPDAIILAVTTHKYREYCGELLKGVLDPEAQHSVVFEVLMVLVGLQTVNEFETRMEHYPLLSVEQGRLFSKKIHDSLFAELALYLPGMGDNSEPALMLDTLQASVAGDDEVLARLEKLPKSVQDVVRSSELEHAFALIQKRYNITENTSRPLGNQIMRVMVGLTTMNNFKVGVTRFAGISPSSLDGLFLEVEQQLFKPVRTTILHALENNMGSLPTKASSVTTESDPYRAPIQ